MSAIYHANGNLAYNPSISKAVYHSNGKLVCNPFISRAVYHSNGNLAYNQSISNKVHDSNGNFYNNSFSLNLQLSEGIQLVVNGGSWSLYVYGQSVYTYKY